MKSIICLLLLGASSIANGNRLLLQQYVPITPAPVIPPPPIVPPPAVPAPPASVVEPVDPAVLPPPPVVPSIPVTPSIPVDPVVPATPVTPAVSTTAAPVVVAPSPPVATRPARPPTYPQYPGMAPKKLECKLSPPNPASCAGSVKDIYDPSIDFELLCAKNSACLGSTINFHFGPYFNPYQEELKGLWFTDVLAAADATITFNHPPNYQGNKLRIAEINCDKLNSCFNTQFVLGPYMEIEIGDFFCAPGACTGCMIKETAADPGLPCYYYTEPI